MGLAVATRTGGIINQVYLTAAMALCAIEALVLARSAARRALVQIVVRSCAAIMLAWFVAWALWPWLQIGNPIAQFKIAYTHFVTLTSEFEFVDWGRRLWTNALPWSYVPDQWLARLPIGFLALLALAVLLTILLQACHDDSQGSGATGLRKCACYLMSSKTRKLSG